jgi:hypothetical protein
LTASPAHLWYVTETVIAQAVTRRVSCNSRRLHSHLEFKTGGIHQDGFDLAIKVDDVDNPIGIVEPNCVVPEPLPFEGVVLKLQESYSG